MSSVDFDYSTGEVPDNELPDEIRLGWPKPKPLPPALAPVKEFNQELLPECFRRFVVDIADRMQCPIDYPAIAVVAVFASLIGRQCGIRPKQHDDWLVIPNLWALIIGRPGVMKSPAIDDLLNIVRTLEVREKERFGKELAAFNQRKELAAIIKKNRIAEIKQAAKDGKTPDELMEMMQDDEEEQPPKRRRYLINDTTVEKLGEILEASPIGPLMERDEIYGWLKTLDKAGHEGARAFFLQAWNGKGRFVYDRVIRGETVIEAAIVSIIGTIQPARLQSYVSDAIEGGSGDDGLLQRFQLAVFPDCPREWRNVDRWPDKQAKEEINTIAEQVANLACEGARQDEFSDVPYVRFTLDAQEMFDAWRYDLEHRLRGDELTPYMESHLAKYRSLVPSLALIFHLVELGAGDVGESSLDRAIHWADYLESHANRIYSAGGRGSAVHALAKKIEARKLRDGFTIRDIYKGKAWSGLSNREDVEEAVESLVELGWLSKVDSEPKPGRPSESYDINPLLFQIDEK